MQPKALECCGIARSEGSNCIGALTFDMRGGRKWAKPACGRPLDGRVRRRVLRSTHSHLLTSRISVRLYVLPVRVASADTVLRPVAAAWADLQLIGAQT